MRWTDCTVNIFPIQLNSRQPAVVLFLSWWGVVVRRTTNDAAAGINSRATAEVNYFHSSRPHLTICRACCADRWNRTQPLRHIPSAAGFFLRLAGRYLIRALQSPVPAICQFFTLRQPSVGYGGNDRRPSCLL